MLHALTSHTDRLSFIRWVLESCVFKPRWLHRTAVIVNIVSIFIAWYLEEAFQLTYYKAAGGGELRQ